MARTRTPSRPQRWSAAVNKAIEALEELRAVQEEYQEWRDNLPENFESSPLAEKLDTICDLDIEGALDTANEAGDADLPRGFGRD